MKSLTAMWGILVLGQAVELCGTSLCHSLVLLYLYWADKTTHTGKGFS